MLVRKSPYSYFVSLIIALAFTLSPVMAQDAVSPTKGYVKMEIGAMGLHCPFLGVTLIDQLKADTAYSELAVDKSDQFLTFSYIRNATYNDAFFEAIAVNVGYPASIVTITISDQQPAIDPRE